MNARFSSSEAGSRGHGGDGGHGADGSRKAVTLTARHLRFARDEVLHGARLSASPLMGNTLLGPRSAKTDPAGASGKGGPHPAGPASPPECARAPAGPCTTCPRVLSL